MADNKSVFQGSAGSSFGVATDEVTYSGDASQQVQLVRSVNITGAEGSKTVVDIPADTEGKQRGLSHKDVLKLQAQSAGLTIATTAYSAGDQVGQLFTFANAARVASGTGLITGVVLTDARDIIGAYDVVFFRSTVTLAADNAAFSVSATDIRAALGVVQLAGSFDFGLGRVVQAQNLAVPYDANTSLFAALICRAGHTFFGATTDLELTVYVERN